MAFLIVFTLIKVNPLYYSLQLIPVPNLTNAARIVKSLAFKGNAFLIKAEKAITDNNDRLNIPVIKFSGVLFTLISTAFLPAFSTQLKRLSAGLASVRIRPAYLLQAAFRL